MIYILFFFFFFHVVCGLRKLKKGRGEIIACTNNLKFKKSIDHSIKSRCVFSFFRPSKRITLLYRFLAVENC
ncbi:hypothetical protein EDC94DRAFT_612931 [Helicostylum pulchrum]|nr:hypothetical protein EDC94DRAFT_612931 [Helicostylum pulchrum]